MDEPISKSANTLAMMALSLSLAAIVMLVIQWIRKKPLIAYEPRKRVPWSIVAIIVPLLCVVQPLIQAIINDPAAVADIQLENFTFSGLISAMVKVGFVIVAMPWLAVICGATVRDLGLPLNLRQLGRDIGIGIFAFLATLLPVYAVQLTLTKIFEPEQNHQLIDLILEHKSAQLLLVGAVMAVIAAPIFEEFTFRVLLQGWLERREDELLGIEATKRPLKTVNKRPNEVEKPQIQAIDSAMLIPDSELSIESQEVELNTSRGMLFGLPHGWAPVLISGLAFGLAHFGQGVAPIPLVLFGIILGYLYQRTHRLAPSITAHALFNAYSLFFLWLQIR